MDLLSWLELTEHISNSMKPIFWTGGKWSLDCDYYTREFETLEELIEDILTSGMDPNYSITRYGEKQTETAWDYIQP